MHMYLYFLMWETWIFHLWNIFNCSHVEKNNIRPGDFNKHNIRQNVNNTTIWDPRRGRKPAQRRLFVNTLEIPKSDKKGIKNDIG